MHFDYSDQISLRYNLRIDMEPGERRQLLYDLRNAQNASSSDIKALGTLLDDMWQRIDELEQQLQQVPMDIR